MLCPTLFRHIQLIGLGLCLTKHVMPGWEGVYTVVYKNRAERRPQHTFRYTYLLLLVTP